MTARTSLGLVAAVGALASAALMAACGDDGTTSTGSTSSNGSTTSSAGGGTTNGSGGAGGGAATNGSGGGGGVDPFAGPVKSLTEVDLGTGDLGQYVFFQIPDRTVGFTVLGETTDAGPFGLNRLRAPSTTSVISGYAIPGTGLTAFVDENVISAQDPQSDLPDAWPVAEGKWLIALGGDGPTSGHARLFVRRTEDGVFHGGAVDINVFMSPGSGAGQSYVNAMLSKLFGTYYTPKIGLSLGNVAYFTVPSSYDDVSTYAEYRTLLSSSAGIGSAPALNLFVIGSMSGELDGALGIAGGIPGSPMVHGTPRSGVAYTPTGNTDYDASVLAHEVGHLAGLFHTSEYQVSAFDPLADTPECPNIMNTNPSNCPDVSNVMFPIAYGGNVMTAWQARVMQGSALYRGALTEGGAFSEPLPTPILPNAAQPSSGVATSFELGEVAVRAPASPIEAALTGHWCAPSPGIASALAAELDDATKATVASLALDPGAFDV
ncbi:MAG TPA: hypothetical protein VL400_10030, partial [Polyangiaceae bacterium]|nr:hypothetical protein [Polyangiaceae bacterium]